LIARAEAKIAEQKPLAAQAAEKAEAAKSRLEKIRRGEAVAGGLGKRLDVVAMLKAAGFTPSMMRRARLLNSLTETEFETLLVQMRAADAVDKAADRELRRLMRKRS